MAMEAMSMTSIADRIEAQLDAGSTEVTLTHAEAVEVATRLHRQAAEPGRCSCGADAYCTDYLTNGYHKRGGTNDHDPSR